ncbi:hypothetical protein AK812_SmicGene29539 [Symbiodinium microadriaticum]|uniref:Uncharacterized protein n=1 Tax=Symbiodinium microadriaticum TaxID=2951 RepID=A0A1Q9D1K6_SYMMI|nr:hypothetical protein AK812_SmicGene29540 [Symbiodinium microadriaticum]OLP89042.1 hypothetical protein AK812_SmicGene29539 [Symbiodinium microadriaticum]
MTIITIIIIIVTITAIIIFCSISTTGFGFIVVSDINAIVVADIATTVTFITTITTVTIISSSGMAFTIFFIVTKTIFNAILIMIIANIRSIESAIWPALSAE